MLYHVSYFKWNNFKKQRSYKYDGMHWRKLLLSFYLISECVHLNMTWFLKWRYLCPVYALGLVLVYYMITCVLERSTVKLKHKYLMYYLSYICCTQITYERLLRTINNIDFYFMLEDFYWYLLNQLNIGLISKEIIPTNDIWYGIEWSDKNLILSIKKVKLTW